MFDSINERHPTYFEISNVITGHCFLISFLLSNTVLPLLHLPPALLSHRLNASSPLNRLSAFSFRMLEAEDHKYSLPVLPSTPSFSTSPCHLRGSFSTFSSFLFTCFFFFSPGNPFCLLVLYEQNHKLIANIVAGRKRARTSQSQYLSHRVGLSGSKLASLVANRTC